MSDWMELAEKRLEERRKAEKEAPRGPEIDGVQFPSPADLRWRKDNTLGVNSYSIEDLRVYGPVHGSRAAYIEVSGLTLGTTAQAEKYYGDIVQAREERRRVTEDRRRLQALEYVRKLAQDPRL